MQPEKEIEKRLLKLKIEARNTRKKIRDFSVIIILLTVLFFLVPYYNPQFNLLYLVDFLFWILGILMYVILSGIPTLVQPLRVEYYAFQKIAEATQTLEKLNDPIAYEQAYRDVKTAYYALKGIGLKNDIAWYKQTNDTIKKFLKNLELIVLPAIKDSNLDSVMKVEHLRQIALAIYSLDPTKLDAVNGTLETEPSYKKAVIKIGERKGEGIGYRALRLFRANDILRIGLVLSLSVVACIFFYYMLVNYVGIHKDYASGEAVALFIGLLTSYFLRPKKTSVQSVG